MILKKISLLIISMAILAACGRKESGNADFISRFDSEVYTPGYATGFRILGNGSDSGSVIIESRNPWQGADSVVTRLFIARNGESAPDGFDGNVLDSEAKRIVAMSSTHIAMLDAIGETDRIVGVSGIDFINNSDIQARRDSIGDVGYEGNINYELLMSLMPDIVLIYGTNSASSMEQKLDELGIPYIYVGDYLEESPLGKAEWMVALGEITGTRSHAETVFADIPKRYNALKALADSLPGPDPKVMLNTPYGDSWFMPSTRNYSSLLIDDAGGDYVYSKNSGNSSTPIDLEEAYHLASGSDVWINVGTARSLDELADMCSKFTDTKPFTTGKVYNNNARSTTAGGNDYFESAIVHPDIVLRDLIKIFHPEAGIEEDFVYYKQLR